MRTVSKHEPSHARVCKRCHKTKPVYEFITGRNINMQVTYSLVCKNCRALIEKETKKLKQPSKIIENKSDT